MSLLDNLPHECSIIKRTFTKDTLGGRKPVNTVLSTGVKCWEQSTGANEVTEYQKQGMKITKKVYFISDPAVTPRHRLIITKRNGTAVPTASQVDLKVLGTPKPDTTVGMEIAYKVMCEEVTSEE